MKKKNVTYYIGDYCIGIINGNLHIYIMLNTYIVKICQNFLSCVFFILKCKTLGFGINNAGVKRDLNPQATP